MVEGAVRHGTSMEVEQNFVDSHVASFVRFGIQSSLGLVNTLMIQDTVALPEWEGVLTDADRAASRHLCALTSTNAIACT